MKPCIFVCTSALKWRMGWCRPAVNLSGTPASRQATITKATCSGEGKAVDSCPPQRSLKHDGALFRAGGAIDRRRRTVQDRQSPVKTVSKHSDKLDCLSAFLIPEMISP